MKKVLSIVLCMALALGIILVGCSQEQPSSDAGTENETSGGETANTENNVTVSPAGTFPLVEDKITFRILSIQDPMVEDYNTNKLTKHMEDTTNVHIEWDLVPQKDAMTKLNLVLASNQDIPDIIMNIELPNDMLVKYGSQGTFLPLNDYIDKYGTEFKKVLEYPGYENLRQEISSADGKIYTLPKVSDSYNVRWGQKMWINQKFLSAVGMDMPETTDDFYNALKAFKEKDPNGNGKADEVPLAGAITGWHTNIDGFIMNAFIYNDGANRFVVNNGNVDVVYNKPEWRDGLAYMAKLAKEGLLDPASFTQDNAQLVQLTENPDAPILGAAPAGTALGFGNIASQRWLDYAAVPPLKGPDGVQLTGYYPPIPQNRFVITKACEYPEVAYRWADFLYNEETSIWSRWGEPGVDWREPKEGELGINGKPAVLVPILQWGSVQNSHWQFQNPGFTPESLQSGQAWDGNPNSPERKWYVETQEKYDGFEPPADTILPPLAFTADEATEYNELRITINDYVNESIARFVTGDMDIDKDWEDYVSQLDDLGLARYLELTQTAYDRQYGNK